MIRTNTILITNITTQDQIQEIRNIIKSRNIIPLAFSPLKSYTRVIITFNNVNDSTFIYQALSDLSFSVHYGQHFYPSRNQSLKVPETTKNFLLSPPGDMPLGWKQISETKPHKMNLNEFLDEATIASLEGDDFCLGASFLDQVDGDGDNISRIEFGVGLPVITIDFEEDTGTGKKVSFIPRTAMPDIYLK